MQTSLTKYIYIYIFHSNSRGLTPLGPARPDKFINLASRVTNIFDIFLKRFRSNPFKGEWENLKGGIYAGCRERLRGQATHNLNTQTKPRLK